MTDPFPHLGPAELKGNPTCGYRLAGALAACDLPAAWHIAWTLVTPADFTLLCDEHLGTVNSQSVYADRHPAEIACDMPGFGWLIGTPSRCITVTTDDTARALAREILGSQP
jgi:hypothetical protein